MRVASKADADAPLNGSERNETAANEAVEAALRYFEEAERMDSSYAPALVGMAQIEMRAAEAAIGSGKIDKASENLELAATFLGDSLNLGEPTIAARRALVECLTAATVLPKSEHFKILSDAFVRSDLDLVRPQAMPPSLSVACRRAVCKLVHADPTDRSAWKLLAAECERSHRQPQGTDDDDDEDGGVAVGESLARPILRSLLSDSSTADNREESADTWTQFGMYASRRGEVSLAQHAFVKAARLDKRTARPWVEYGKLCLSQGDAALGEEAFGRALQLAPRQAHAAWLGLARCHKLKRSKAIASPMPSSPSSPKEVNEEEIFAMLVQSIEQRITLDGLAALAEAASRLRKPQIAHYAAVLLRVWAPNRPESHLVLGYQALRCMGRQTAEAPLREAIALLTRKVARAAAKGRATTVLHRQLGEARLNLARVLAVLGRLGEATELLDALDAQLAAAPQPQPAASAGRGRGFGGGRGFGRQQQPPAAVQTESVEKDTLGDGSAKLRLLLARGGEVKEEEMLVYNKGDEDDDEIDEWVEDGMPEWVEDGMPSTLFATVKEQGLDKPHNLLTSYAPPPPPAATSMAAATTATSSAIEPGTIEVVATIGDTRVSVLRKDLEDEESIGDVDPRFFDPDYSVAASTGMVMWEGSWAAVELLRKESSWLLDMLRGKRVVELGSGIGLLGLCAAAAGSHVLLTDVPSVVEERLEPNLQHATTGPPIGAADGWLDARTLGRGSAAVQPLDWYKRVDEQATPNDPRECDLILAAECVWLRELVEPFVETVVALMRGPKKPKCILAFRERAKAESTTFSSLATVAETFRERGVTIKEDLGSYDAPESEGLLTVFYVLSLDTSSSQGT